MYDIVMHQRPALLYSVHHKSMDDDDDDDDFKYGDLTALCALCR